MAKRIFLLCAIMAALVAASTAHATTPPSGGTPDVLCGPGGCGGGGGGNCHPSGNTGYSYVGYAKNTLPALGSPFYGTVTDEGSATENVNNTNHVLGALFLTNSSGSYWIAVGLWKQDGGADSQLYIEVVSPTYPRSNPYRVFLGAATNYTAYPFYIYNEGGSYIAYVNGAYAGTFTIPGLNQSQYTGEAYSADGTCDFLYYQFGGMSPWTTGDGTGSTMYQWSSNTFGVYADTNIGPHTFAAYGG